MTLSKSRRKQCKLALLWIEVIEKICDISIWGKDLDLYLERHHVGKSDLEYRWILTSSQSWSWRARRRASLAAATHSAPFPRFRPFSTRSEMVARRPSRKSGAYLNKKKSTVIIPVILQQCCGSGSICFGPPEFESISTRYGSGSFYYQAKIVRKTLIPTVLLTSLWLWKSM